ncbi:putative enoyl-CoA hydratase [Gordonia polyisoprenivorans NBRC 16320 = JCM 10675]|uniref:Enoyl-CoA hydratase/isomerase family protein n=1 Tax=Gordonia polyisoprenivorans TaxID=84595 RepID=A0A846WVX4_9ACTN|nr:enoyl-CoA hydratase-related protein [Gordonia polyisoprenivorans]NKY05197.1 enoyl-CoA hydratase/isomerase family protein [Gordonia polyisoprenivorans]GAB24066.1 putative enoyl-CoA hydratase [Gordonia polyisoprenivorans NBRC 16320 = JCM 10675]
MTEPVIYSVVDGIAWITMNRPAARNALNKAVREGLEDAFARAEGDDSAAVVVLTGAGDKAFCSGGDLKEMAENSLGVPPPDYVPQPNRTIEMTKPLIAAVNGHAFAGGFLLMQSADLVVVADHARLGITEAVVGRGAPWAVPLPWLIPPRVAMQMLLTGEPISAARAFEVGLVNEVVPAAELVGATTRLARRIASNAPLSVRAGKATVYAAARECRDQAFESAEKLWEKVYLSADAQEGPRAFAEKRTPVWVGR